jgi:hypothetical protein
LPGQQPGDAGAGTLIEQRGRPENLRSDNGPEFTSRGMLGWAEDWKVGLVYIQPGCPMQNGHVESFHWRLRDECLNASWFRSSTTFGQLWQPGARSTTASGRIVRSTTEPWRSSGLPWAIEMWRAQNASHIPQPRLQRRDIFVAKSDPRNSSYQWVRIRSRSPPGSVYTT